MKTHDKYPVCITGEMLRRQNAIRKADGREPIETFGTKGNDSFIVAYAKLAEPESLSEVESAIAKTAELNGITIGTDEMLSAIYSAIKAVVANPLRRQFNSVQTEAATKRAEQAKAKAERTAVAAQNAIATMVNGKLSADQLAELRRLLLQNLS